MRAQEMTPFSDTDASLTGEDRALTEQYIEKWVSVLI